MVLVQYKVLPHGKGLPPPLRATKGAAGIDLCAAISKDKDITLESGGRLLVPTGISLELPPGYEAQIRPRSGLAHKLGITVLNSPGTIDSDYRGEIKVLLINLGPMGWIFKLKRGERIAQLVVMPVPTVTLKEVNDLDDTKRGEGGFGSTGSW